MAASSAAHETLCAMLAIAAEHDLLIENAAKRIRYPAEGLELRDWGPRSSG